MTPSLSLTESQTLTALRSFLLSILPASVEVIQGQGNRVPEPMGVDFVTMTPLRQERIETNIDAYVDAVFVGSIAGATMTITEVRHGALAVGRSVFGIGVAQGTSVTAFGTGTGGVGTYSIAPAQTVASGTLAAGVAEILQPTKATIQLDVHGPSGSDNAQIISTLMRDRFAVERFHASGFDVTPLYADDPRQMPFLNAEQQYEDRYVIEAVLQVNPIVTAGPQQFADQLSVTPINVQARYPAIEE